MSMRDLYHKSAAQVLIANATYAADNTPGAVDLKGAQGALIVLEIGAGGISFSGTNKIEMTLTHSDDGSTYTNVTDADMVGVSGISNGIVRSLTTAKAAADVQLMSYKGNKRYLKFLAHFSGTHGTGTPIGATVVQQNLNISTP